LDIVWYSLSLLDLFGDADPRGDASHESGRFVLLRDLTDHVRDVTYERVERTGHPADACCQTAGNRPEQLLA